MKKVLLVISIAIIFITLSLFIVLNISINKSIKDNNKIINKFDDIFQDSSLDIGFIYNNNLPKIEFDDNDYIGVISMTKNNLRLPVKASCNNSIITSACSYSNNSLVILGTNLKNSFKSFELYDVDDSIIFTNTLGQIFKYRIKDINRINKLNINEQYDADLIIIIKNYYTLEYILFLCDLY